MKIDSILIENFRGIQKVVAEQLGDTIIIAGQNGSGKSCIFDAIRLLKSVYGGYQQNEWQQFFGEFQIQLHGGAKNLKGLFNDAHKNLVITCAFVLRDHEKAYINENAADLLEQTIWQTLVPEAFQYGGYRKALFSSQFRDRQPEVTARVNAELPSLMNELAKEKLFGSVKVTPSGEIKTVNSRLLAVIFSNYRPRDIGVIDFHGAQRHYGREVVQGINLNLDQKNHQYSQHTLYNYSNKYNNVKSEMAGSYIKEILAKKAGQADGQEIESLSDTLKELFESFFPDKKFMGPQATPDGSLSFPVVTPSGQEHDLDELSSGEKEILYGYLRIRSSAPRDSIILLDEPELHLNPRLIRGLPEFYRKHLGEKLQNQLWLVTHSDALIREAVGKPGFNVYHMLPSGADSSEISQLRPLKVTADLDLVLADLVGDLAAYRPGGKGVIFEGGGDSDFDKTFAAALFAEELKGVNLISGSNKIRVSLLHEILERAYDQGDLPTKFFAIVDSDTDGPNGGGEAVNRFEWDVYHIENYLLDVEIISEVLNGAQLGKTYSPEDMSNKLREAARNVVPTIILQMLRSFVNSRIVPNIDLGFDPKRIDAGKAMSEAVERSAKKIKEAVEATLSEEIIVSYEAELRSQVEQSFADGSWSKTLPGRDILKQFVAQEQLKFGYELLRNLIVSRMAEKGRKPAGMKAVFDKIMAE